jgi:hypothetical protein
MVHSYHWILENGLTRDVYVTRPGSKPRPRGAHDYGFALHEGLAQYLTAHPDEARRLAAKYGWPDVLLGIPPLTHQQESMP